MGTLNRHDLRHASVMYDDFFEMGGTCFDTARTYREMAGRRRPWG